MKNQSSTNQHNYLQTISWYDAEARPGQLLATHANNVSHRAALYGEKCGIAEIVRIAGLFHDLGKVTQDFQNKLKGNTAQNKHVEHSVYGGRRVFEDVSPLPPVAEILSNIISAHHGQLYDNISPDGETTLRDKMQKQNVGLLPAPPDDSAINIEKMKAELVSTINKLHDQDKAFGLSMLTKLAYSCLVDADRLDAYLHDKHMLASQDEIIINTQLQTDKQLESAYNWDSLLTHLNGYLKAKNNNASSEMAVFRQHVSDNCAKAGTRAKGIYKLEVPTGGGKTLSSLRFALTHAKAHKMDRIIYVIPYLSILSQTAAELRQALGADENTVLEHHSGFLPADDENSTALYKLHTDRWDAPIILTTQVQFLESIFSARASDLRKLHNMANSVLIFDEAQSLPIKCVHLFNSAMNFLHRVCGSTILTCTATQPLLDKVSIQLHFSENPSLVECPPISKRTEIINSTKHGGYTYPELASFVLDKHNKSTLVIVNTKAAAKALYDELRHTNTNVLHLSTNMCGAHRDDVLAELRIRLKLGVPVICVSTQLIEAGVDISLECVIRDIAGLDSIHQAAGRCNRHGEFGEVKNVYVIDIAGENLSKLDDIKAGADATRRIFSEKHDDEMKAFYEYYFYNRKDKMDFIINGSDTVYDLLSHNFRGTNGYANRKDKHGIPQPFMKSAPRSAADAFHVIGQGRTDIIVPYGFALDLVEQYARTQCFDEKRKLQRLLGRYSVSLYRYQIEALGSRALRPVEELTVLVKGFYDDAIGINVDGQHDFLFM